jgi:hypothetical protein
VRSFLGNPLPLWTATMKGLAREQICYYGTPAINAHALASKGMR